MGGKSGGGQSTPYEAPNTLNSAQALRIIDAISEGVVDGFANGNDAPFKSVFFDDTPVQNADGSFNFKGVVGFFQRGTPDQDYVPGFDVSERTISVSARVRKETPIVRAVTDNLVSRVRVTVGVERNSHTKDNGDTVAANTTMLVELVNANGVATARTVSFTEKGSGAYYQDVLIDDLPEVPFNIRVSRVTADSTTDKISNNTFFASYVEIVDAKLSYPHTAVASLAIDSDQFGSSLPRRNYLLKGRLVKVPSNYDPVARIYGAGAWDGSFKAAWTNNPAWVFYDVLTQSRFSTLARRLKVADIDKWSLYQIARYCDEPVDDGFGGKEPRFVCNAYITDSRQAGEFLLDLASIFTGLPIWNGNQVSVVMDADSDPVALYNNSNVKDGLFSYGGAAYKAIHTAVEVQYLDKYDGYRSKIELVKDDAAIKRYGLNPKRITAFGCDSRGQAARFGAWVLQTELRQQHTVSFTVGREGLRHLPYDVVTVMDNSYAGADLSGRVAAVNGDVVTLDRDVADVGGALFYYSNSDGLQSVKVLAQPAANQLRLASVAGLAESAGWAISGKVQARQYRAIGIKENTDEGTYTITALLHDPAKYAAVDTWASFDKEITTLHTLTPTLLNGEVATDGNTVVITWDNLTASGQVLTYDIKIYRNNQLYRHTPAATSAEIRLENLPNGDYRAEIRGRNARGVLSEPLIKAWTIDYTITGLRTKPQMFAINLVWTLPQTVVSNIHTEVWYATTNNIASATKLASVPYPQSEYTLANVALADRFWFWVRIVDAAGNTGEFTAAVEGVADSNPAELVKVIQKEFTESELTKDLIALLEGEITEGLLAEANSRTEAINVLRAEASAALLATASELGTKITNVENVNASQAQQINTVTAAQGATAAGLETEKKARADGDAAEAAARSTLAGRVTAAEGSITRNDGLRVTGDKANADAIAAMGVRVGSAEGSIVRNDNLRITGDKANADAISAMGVRVGSAESGITALQTTVASNQAASATQIRSLQASIDNGSSGTNLIPNSDFAAGYDGWNMFNWSNTTGLTTGFNLEAGAVNKYNLKDERVFFVRDDRTAAAGDTYLQVIAQNNRARFAVTPGEILQGSVLAAGIAMISGIEAVHVYIDFYDMNNVFLGRGIRNIDNAKTPATGHLNGGRNDGAYTSLDRFHTLWANEVVPANAVWGQLSVRFWFNPSVAARYGFFVRPQVCTVPSLSHGYVPYQVGTYGLSAQVTQASSAVTTLDGKVRAMHTVKVETLSGGRKVVAGLALGADGATGDSQVLIYADKFGLVNPSSKQIDTPFVVTTNAGGSAQMALKGDFIATDSILARHIAANQSITSPIINSGVINSGTINGGLIKGARIEAVDLEAVNIIGDVVATRVFGASGGDLVCNIPSSRKSKRTIVLPQVLAFADAGDTVVLDLYFDGTLITKKTIKSVTKKINYAKEYRYDTWTPATTVSFWTGSQNQSVTIPSVNISGNIPIEFELPYDLPKVGGVGMTQAIDGGTHSIKISCSVNGVKNLDPLGDVSAIACFII